MNITFSAGRDRTIDIFSYFNYTLYYIFENSSNKTTINTSIIVYFNVNASLHFVLSAVNFKLLLTHVPIFILTRTLVNSL